MLFKKKAFDVLRTSNLPNNKVCCINQTNPLIRTHARAPRAGSTTGTKDLVLMTWNSYYARYCKDYFSFVGGIFDLARPNIFVNCTHR